MKVLHLSGATSWGGNEQQLVDSIPDLEKLGVENTIYCFKNSPLEGYAQKNNISYQSVRNTKLFSYWYNSKFSKYAKNNNFDIVHLHTSDSVTAFVISDLLFKLNIPGVFSKKGISGKKKGLSAYKYNYKAIKKIICVSNAVRESFKETLKSDNHHKLITIYDGIRINRDQNKSRVNIRMDFNIEKEKILIGNIANHNKAKDLVTFVKSVNELVNILGEKNVHFIQIGYRSKYTDVFEPLIYKFNLKEYITLIGFQENAMDLLSQLDIYFMTSEREGLPITIYEAFLKKIPIVSTKAGGIPEAIKHNSNGLLSEVRDFRHLAKNLKLIMSSKKLRNQFTERSYDLLFKKFTTKELTKEVFNIYKLILDEK